MYHLKILQLYFVNIYNILLGAIKEIIIERIIYFKKTLQTEKCIWVPNFLIQIDVIRAIRCFKMKMIFHFKYIFFIYKNNLILNVLQQSIKL